VTLSRSGVESISVLKKPEMGDLPIIFFYMHQGYNDRCFLVLIVRFKGLSDTVVTLSDS